jgi:broad specificity phosphatase PhoE/ribonuclease HI
MAGQREGGPSGAGGAAMTRAAARRLTVEADGGSRGNPGPAGYGAVVRDAGTGQVLAEISESIGVATNNVAEYSGLIAGLRAAAELGPGAEVAVRMDSRLVVEQMSGRWKIRHPDIQPLAASAARLARRFARVSYTWVPRARNAHADRLANEAMDAAERMRGSRPGNARRPAPVARPGPGTGEEAGAAAGAGTRRDAGGTAGAAPPSARRPAATGTRSTEDGAEPPPVRNSLSSRADGRPASGPRTGPGWGSPHGQPTVTLLLRHGQTPLSAERRFAGTGDTGLTEAGLRQAKLAGARLAARGGVDVIVTSPLRRARQTAAEVAAATGAPVTCDEGFRETDFGEWEGLTFAEAQQRWPDEVAAWLADPAASPPGGESFAAVGERVKAALGRLLAAHARETVLVVSHVTPIKTLLTAALLAPHAAMYRINLDVACLNEIHWYADGPAVVTSLNDTAHLR